MSQENKQVSRSAKAESINTGFAERLREKWELDSLWQVLLVLVVFAATGSTVVFLRGLFFSAIGFDATTPMWLKTVTYILFVMPAYQVLLLFYGSLLGQFRFFWNKEKKMLRFLVKLFKR